MLITNYEERQKVQVFNIFCKRIALNILETATCHKLQVRHIFTPLEDVAVHRLPGQDYIFAYGRCPLVDRGLVLSSNIL